MIDVIANRLDFKGMIDYIFYSRDSFRCLGILGPVDESWFIENRVPGCPYSHYPSDHIPIQVELELYLDAQPTFLTASSTHSSPPTGPPGAIGQSPYAPQHMGAPFLGAGLGAQMSMAPGPGPISMRYPSLQPMPLAYGPGAPPFPLGPPTGPSGPGGPLGAPPMPPGTSAPMGHAPFAPATSHYPPQTYSAGVHPAALFRR